MKKINISSDLIKIIISTILFIVSYLCDGMISKVLLILSYILISYEIYIEAIKDIFKGEIFNENFLMIIATLGAFYIKEYPEAVMVMLLFEFGEYLSDSAVSKSKKAITELVDLRSEYINKKVNNKIEKVDIRKAKVNDIFIVKPGEKIPLDGIVLDGESLVDTSKLTGESILRRVKKDDEVLSGFINQDAIITIKATSSYKTSTASKIIELIENSNDKKTKTEKFITKFAKIYTPIVVALALLILIIPVVFFKQNFNVWAYRAIVFLVTSCPCALVISVPLGFFCGIGRASKEGILVKGSNELDKLTDIKTLVFDKTGTITKGVFKVTDILSYKKEITKDELLELVAYAEYYSNHPIAKSILYKYNKKIDESKIKDFKEKSGQGIDVTIDGNFIILGTKKHLKSHNIEIDKEVDSIGTNVYVAKNNKYIGCIIVSDEIKKEAYTLVNNLKNEGISNVVMLSGDSIAIVNKVGKKVNIDSYYGNLLPIDKVNQVEKLKKENFTAFVGDGINDAPVIKLSNIGIAMGGIGSDATIEAADIVLMKDDLNLIAKAIKISKITKKIIKFNITFALCFKAIILILGTLGLTSIWMAVFADVGVTLLLVLNTLRIMKKKI